MKVERAAAATADIDFAAEEIALECGGGQRAIVEAVRYQERAIELEAVDGQPLQIA